MRPIAASSRGRADRVTPARASRHRKAHGWPLSAVATRCGSVASDGLYEKSFRYLSRVKATHARAQPPIILGILTNWLFASTAV